MSVMTFSIRPANASDADEISGLITGWAHHYLEDSPPPEAAVFLATLTPSATAERIGSPSFRYYVAEDAGAIVGVIALREGFHLYHLFVREDAHGRGIARSLWERAKSESGSPSFMVNSSLPAIPVYERFGFVATESAQSKNGLVYVPMAYEDEG